MLRKLHKHFMMHNMFRPVNSEVTLQMRMVLVDWLIDVSMHFDLKFDTLHLAINYL